MKPKVMSLKQSIKLILSQTAKEKIIQKKQIFSLRNKSGIMKTDAGSGGEESTHNVGFDPWIGKISWKR